MQLVKLYQPKGNRDYFYLILLSFLQVLAASSLTINISFFVGFLVFVLVCLAALMSFEMKRALQASLSRSKGLAIGTEDAHIQQPFELGLGLAEQRSAVGAILLVSSASLCIISVLGTALFFAIPRFGAGYFSRTLSKTLSLSGFSDRIRLGSIGIIHLDPSIGPLVHLPPAAQDREPEAGDTLHAREVEAHPPGALALALQEQAVELAGAVGIHHALEGEVEIVGRSDPLDLEPLHEALPVPPGPDPGSVSSPSPRS